jgi:hypothetical protein
METIAKYECIEELENSQVTWNGSLYSPSDLLAFELDTLYEILASIELRLQWEQEQLDRMASQGEYISPRDRARARSIFRMIAAHRVVVKTAIKKKKIYDHEKRIADIAREKAERDNRIREERKKKVKEEQLKANERRAERQRIKEENVRRTQEEILIYEGIAKAIHPGSIVFQYHFYEAAKQNLSTDEFSRICNIAGQAKDKVIGRCPS